MFLICILHCQSSLNSGSDSLLSDASFTSRDKYKFDTHQESKGSADFRAKDADIRIPERQADKYNCNVPLLNQQLESTQVAEWPPFGR